MDFPMTSISTLVPSTEGPRARGTLKTRVTDSSLPVALTYESEYRAVPSPVREAVIYTLRPSRYNPNTDNARGVVRIPYWTAASRLSVIRCAADKFSVIGGAVPTTR